MTIAERIHRNGPDPVRRVRRRRAVRAGGLLHTRRGRRTVGSGLRDQPRGRPAVRCLRGPRARRRVGPSRAARSVRGRRGRRGHGPPRARRAPGRAGVREPRSTTCWWSAAPRLRAEQATRLPLEPVADALGPASRAEPGDTPEPVGGLGPVIGALDELPALPVEGVVLANELLDNLAFEIVVAHRTGLGRGPRRGRRRRLVRRGARSRRPTTWRAGSTPSMRPPAPGCRSPPARWSGSRPAASVLHRGTLLLVDYTAEWHELVARSRRLAADLRGPRTGPRPARRPGIAGRHDRCPGRDGAPCRGSRPASVPASESNQATWLRGLGIDGPRGRGSGAVAGRRGGAGPGGVGRAQPHHGGRGAHRRRRAGCPHGARGSRRR